VAPGEGPLPNYSDYSGSPFPQWPVATWNCLPDGGHLIKKQAEMFRYWGNVPTVKSAVADNCERDIETAQSLLSGLGLPDFDILVEESLFNPFPSVCPQPSAQFYDSALQLRASSVQPLANRARLMDDLQKHLGKGAAPPISDIPEEFLNRQLTGARALASDFAEFFLMSYGGGLNTSWANISSDDVYKFAPLTSYRSSIEARTLSIVQHTHSNLLWRLKQELHRMRSLGGGSSLFVGHDSDLDAIATFFNLEWSSGLLPMNYTAPGAALIFRVQAGQSDDDATVVAGFYTPNFEKKNGEMTISQATFMETSTNMLPLQRFDDIVSSLVYLPCVNQSILPMFTV
jgi:hypothetical protein